MIEDPKKYCDGLWNWDILEGCFGETKIKVTDIDGAIERNGELLLLETKKPGTQIKSGQQIMFRNLTGKGITTMLVWGDKDTPEYMRLYNTSYPDGSRLINCDLQQFRNHVSWWYHWACQQTTPSFV